MPWKSIFLILSFFYNFTADARVINVGTQMQFQKIREALSDARSGDTILVHKGLYKEGNLIINKSIYLKGIDMPVLDGERKYEIISVKSSNVTVDGFRLQHSGFSSIGDPGAIKVYGSKNVTIQNNSLFDNSFGIYLQFCSNSKVLNNVIVAFGKQEQEIGNGIHCWKSDSLQICGNQISGQRDGIYFEFVTHSVIWRNLSTNNIRYGLHFMFSNNDSYFTNYFKHNGAGVSVMFTNNVVMMNNTFEENWGDAAYGILLKEISDCYMGGNKFIGNTTAIFMDGTNRIRMEKNILKGNGWGLKIQANCVDNYIEHNNFFGNTFDVGTNGTLTLNTFNENYWDKYEGYDLNKDRIGDLPYHPLSLFSVIVERNPPAMLLYRSFMVSLLDKSEKILPSLTPENFIDNKPLMHPLVL